MLKNLIWVPQKTHENIIFAAYNNIDLLQSMI